MQGLSVPLYGKTAPKKPASKKTSQERADDALVSMFPHYFEAKKADAAAPAAAEGKDAEDATK